MTTEEKAKAYDEALAKCKAYIEDTKKRWSEEFCKATEKVFEEIFPQLRGSDDERHRKWILEYLYDGLRKADEQFKDHFKAAIAWLEKQKEQKPAEWSEEDEKYLNRVINLWVNDFGEDSDTVKWLKSLRPSWKPTYEQMEALRKAVNKLADTEVADSVRLSIMYDHLKELI